MKLSKFRFDLPEQLIAQRPKPQRDEARMMVVDRRTGEVSHHIFKEIINYFDAGDVMVFNDTKVVPARLYGNKEKTGARIEVFLLRELNEDNKMWDVLVEPARKIRIGNKLYFGDDASIIAEVIDNTTSRGRTLRFLYDGPHDEFRKALLDLGKPPLPLYIHREAENVDFERFQSIFGRNEGAVVAPAAGFHFSRELLKRLEIKGVEQAFCTVHSGLGNYRAIDVEDLTKHRMDSEEYSVPQQLVNTVNSAKDQGRRICAVSTSVLRALVTATSMEGHIKPCAGWTNKFIFPPFEFTVADALVTNFHLPLSTMLMMTCAFGGYETVMNAYKTAIREKYRFGVYGDAMLIV